MILAKTETGLQVFKDRSVRLTPRQRSAFILFDGQRSVADVLTSGMGIASEDVDQMVELGLLAVMPRSSGSLSPAPVFAATDQPVVSLSESANRVTTERGAAAVEPQSASPLDTVRDAQQRYQDAYPIATRLTASLGLRGFRLNLAVEGSSNHQDLLALAPKIRAAVGGAKAEPLDRALGI